MTMQRSEILGFDRLEEHPNVPAIDLMSDAETPRGLKRKSQTYVSNYTINYNL